MRRITPGVWVALLTTASANPVKAQAINVVQKLAQRMVQLQGKQLTRELGEQAALKAERQIVFREAEEASRLLARPLRATTGNALLGRFNRLSRVDDALRAEFTALSLADRRLVVELGEGIQQVLRRYPEDGLSLLRQLDVGGLAQVRTYGDFVLDGARWLHSDEVLSALQANKLSGEEAAAAQRVLGLKAVPEILEPAHVAPLWKAVVRKTGDGAGGFWRNWIVPHQKKWAAGGLLATYLIMPDKFHDAAGNLTEYGVRRLSELGVSVALGASRGAIEGPVDAVKKGFADNPTMTILGLFLIAILVLLAVPAARRFLWHKGFLRVFPSWRVNAAGSPGFSHPSPLRE